MKLMRKKIFCLLCLPNLVFASLGEDLNSLLDKFFGSGQAPPEETEFIEPEPLDIPDIEIPQNPEETDLSQIREEIFLEEMGVGEFKKERQERESYLEVLQEQKNALKNQLFLLDSQVGTNSKALESYTKDEKKWKEALEKLTYERSDLKAEIKIAQQDYERFMSKNFIQLENLNSTEDVSIVSWLFSNKTVSEILEERRKKMFFAEQKTAKVEHLETLKKQLEKQEKQASLFYGKLSKLSYNAANDKKNYEALAEKKAKKLQQIEVDEYQKNNELLNIERQENESAIYLQNLRLALKKTQEKLKEKYENPEAFLEIEKETAVKKFFNFPLKINQKITATFHDPAYKKEFEREHEGVDFFAPQGTDVFAPADGFVKKTGLHNFGYSYLILQHKNGFYTVYGHVSEILVNEDQKVKKGDLIAKTGGTAGTKGAGYFTSGPHLHFEVFRDGENLNPMDYLE